MVGHIRYPLVAVTTLSLPPSLLAEVEAHPCVTGCYDGDARLNVCAVPGRAPARAVSAKCLDCLIYRPAILTDFLGGPGISPDDLAAALSEHVRALRGYRWATSGYHVGVKGVWLSVVYYGRGLFLVDGSRNRNGVSDLAALIDAFCAGLLTPEDPRMIDDALYDVEVVHLNMARPIPRVRSKSDIISSPQCTMQPTSGYHRYSLIEFLPLSSVADAEESEHDTAAGRDDGTCPICGAEIKERQLLSGTFVGCLC